MRILGTEKEKEVQNKGMHKILNKIKTENFPNHEKVLPIQNRKPSGHQIDLTKIEPPHGMLSSKQQVQRTEKGY
jgi:hypothetical protein